MQNTYFKTVALKVGQGKMILLSVVDENFLDAEVENIAEMQCIKMAPNIYTGTYPTIKVNLETLEERPDLKGIGAAGILMQEPWYCDTQKDPNTFGINLKKDWIKYSFLVEDHIMPDPNPDMDFPYKYEKKEEIEKDGKTYVPVTAWLPKEAYFDQYWSDYEELTEVECFKPNSL